MKAIVAVSKNGVIGKNNKIPWHNPIDFEFFKKKTSKQRLIMGAKTFDSLDCDYLPNRLTYILTKKELKNGEGKGYIFSDEFKKDSFVSGYLYYNNWRNIPDVFNEDIWVCGGAEIYEELFPYCTDIYVSLIKEMVKEDDINNVIYCPPIPNIFSVAEQIKYKELDILHYRRNG